MYIITDIEGVAGITNWQDFGRPNRMYYELGKELTTREINAACEGFFAAGATEIVVDDAHGRGGINQLDPRVQILGASSDHLVLDVHDLPVAPRVGDAIQFRPTYSATLRLFTSPYVLKEHLNG